MIRILLFLLVVSPTYLSIAQINTEADKEIQQELAEMDTIILDNFSDLEVVELESANIYHLSLKSDLEKKYYIWLRQRVRDVWPYVKVAVEEYNAIEDTAKYFKNNRQKKKYVKKRQKVLAEQFEKQLKDLSKSRGQILVKLIHRETDLTTYEMISEIKGSFNAFIWNSAGGAFDLDLKTKFNPVETREDLYIEIILRRDFASGRLEPINNITK